MSKPTLLTRITYLTAVVLALFSGAVSTYGLTRFAPGAEWVIAAMGLLFEAGKLTAFSMMHRQIPAPLKAGLLAVGVILMTLNIVGVSGFMSNAYEKAQVVARAASHTASAEAAAAVTTLDRQLATADKAVAEARAAMAKAKGDRDQIRAVTAMVTNATADRDRIARDLANAQARQAKAEGATIAASAEFAAIAFLAAATGTAQSQVAHLIILVVSSLLDILAALLIITAPYTRLDVTPAAPAPIQAPAEVIPVLTPRQIAARQGAKTRRKNERRRAKARKTGPQLAYTN
jgi:hypothetical protein